MDIFKIYQCLQFNDYFPLYNKVSPSRTDIYSIIINYLLNFPSKIQTGSFHFNRKATLINHFLKTVAKRVMDFHSTADYLISNIFQFHTIIPFQ